MNALQKAGMLQLLPKMTDINAISCMREFDKAYGIKLDWHEFSSYLDNLNTKKIVRVVKPGGMIGYALNRE